MNIKESFTMSRLSALAGNLVALLANLLLVYVLYSLCRLLFLWDNAGLYAGITADDVLRLLSAGLIFDSSAIIYTNAIIILLFLLPLHWKERAGFYRVARWVFTVVNAICLVINLCDVVYFPFTGRRTTASVFQEFQNEGTGNLLKIFADQGLEHWPLIVAFVAMVAALWYGYRKPRYEELTVKKGLVPYYVVNFVLLAVCSVISVGLMRGGFSHATRPITISNASKYAKNPAETGVILNTPFSLIRTFDKKPLLKPDYMSGAEAERIFNPLHAPDSKLNSQHSTLNTPPNVVILIMESFSKQHSGFYNAKHNENGKEGDKVTFTPFLDSLCDSALTFRHSYANGRKSIEGMPSILSSIPNFVEPLFLTSASLNNLSGIARELSENKGYTSAFFHGAENGSMGFEAFACATGFQKYYGRTEYCNDPNYHGDDDFDGTWAIWDEEFLQFYADHITDLKEPFVSAVFTASSHTPFDLPERYIGKFPKGKRPIQECVAYADYALRLFFDKIKKQPWFNNTIFVITADHVSGQADTFYETPLGHYCIPIIFYAPGIPELKLCGYDEHTIVEQTDIMPTLLGLLGYDKPYIAFGKDILNTPQEQSTALHWVPEFQGYEFVANNYVMRFDGKNVTAVYDLKKDLYQRRDISATMPRHTRDSLERRMKAEIQIYMKRMNENTLTVKKGK